MKKKESKSETKRKKEKGKGTMKEESKSQKERGKKKIIQVSQPMGVKKGPLGQEGTLSSRMSSQKITLPPLRGIEHHIDLTLEATLPNREHIRQT
ncbi:hypothetical protein CR513_29862, partial [Mucuna pruriens]